MIWIGYVQIRDKDYKVYGGGLGVNLVFQKEGLNKVKL